MVDYLRLSHEDDRDADIDDFAKALATVFEGKATILDRMRLSCIFYDGESKEIGTDDVGQCTFFNTNNCA